MPLEGLEPTVPVRAAVLQTAGATGAPSEAGASRENRTPARTLATSHATTTSCSLAPSVGFEPTTKRLTAARTTAVLRRLDPGAGVEPALLGSEPSCLPLTPRMAYAEGFGPPCRSFGGCCFPVKPRILVPLAGFGPAIFSLRGRRPRPLDQSGWCLGSGSNRQPKVFQALALPSELPKLAPRTGFDPATSTLTG